MLENNVLQHIIIDPAGQLAPRNTRGRSWYLVTVEDRRTTRASDKGQREGKKKKKKKKKNLQL